MPLAGIGNMRYNWSMAKAGAPTKYNEDFHPLLVELLARVGCTDKQMAEHLKISEKTLNTWKNKYPVFLQSLKKGKETPDDQVESALLKRALGFHVDAVKIFMPAGAKEPVYADYKEYYPPETMAIIYWLNNRRPNRWKRNPEDKEKDETISKLLAIAERLTSGHD